MRDWERFFAKRDPIVRVAWHMSWIAPALTPGEVAEWLGVSRLTLGIWRFRKSGPSYLKFGRTIRYQADDVEEWMAGRG